MSRRASCGAVAALVMATVLHAHNGPPYPILSDKGAGPYIVSVWTDPDTTDDGSPGGQFWVRLHAPGHAAGVPQPTRATVTITPLDRSGPVRSAAASPVRDDITNQFAALVMDHEGRFAVHVAIDGPLGAAAIDSAVEATYDLRPARSLLVLYLLPFVLIGLLWVRLLARRRAQNGGRAPSRPDSPPGRR
jgi:hypothetical protein